MRNAAAFSAHCPVWELETGQGRKEPAGCALKTRGDYKSGSMPAAAKTLLDVRADRRSSAGGERHKRHVTTHFLFTGL